MILKKTQIHSEILSFSVHRNDSARLENTHYKYIEKSFPVFENSVKSLNKEITETEKILPIINRCPHIIEQKTPDNKVERMRKHSQSLIAYVPTVSYTNDNKEETHDMYTYKKSKHQGKNLQAFLQLRNGLKKSI